MHLGHLLLVEGAVDRTPPEFETDRARFLGRGRSLAAPVALDPGATLSGTVGNVLDPIFALRRVVHLEPGESARIVAILAAGGDADQLRALLTPAYAAAAHQLFNAAARRDQM